MWIFGFIVKRNVSGDGMAISDGRCLGAFLSY